jgi:hypothetical protein
MACTTAAWQNTNLAKCLNIYPESMLARLFAPSGMTSDFFSPYGVAGDASDSADVQS